MDAPLTYEMYRELFASEMTDARADKLLVQEAGRAMGKKLQKKRREGYGGWWDENLCTIENLRELLRSHIDKGDMVDVANFAMMIHMRKILEK